jgi:tRNA threonylcarbamoyladenosine biosynthesis protein TsaE
MNRYDGKEYPLWHIDLYRIEGDEIEDFQIEELLEEGVLVVEWAERRDWKKWVIRVEIEVIGDEERRIVIERPQF